MFYLAGLFIGIMWLLISVAIVTGQSPFSGVVSVWQVFGWLILATVLHLLGDLFLGIGFLFHFITIFYFVYKWFGAEVKKVFYILGIYYGIPSILAMLFKFLT
ncbi:MAG: hypothetical protein P9X24_11280 [Candidatus Hatepunaea meridiana]|nr:hypothetical protein [Candidatus Hatepunaea meridiana]